MMDIHEILKQRIDGQFPDYVVQFKDVPEEEGLVSINIFGVSREDFHDVKEFVFDLEDELSVDETFIPICYTKQEVMDHYPAIASVYVSKQKSLLKKKEAEVFSLAFESYDFSNCSCSQRLRGDVSGLDRFFSLEPLWNAKNQKTANMPSVNANDDRYALAA